MLLKPPSHFCRSNCENICIVPYFAEDRKDLEISKSSILKKKKRSMEDFGPERTWTVDPWLKKRSSIHLSYLQLDDLERKKSTTVLTCAVKPWWPATSLYSFCLSSQKRNLYGGVFVVVFENMLSSIVPSFSVSMANRNFELGYYCIRSTGSWKYYFLLSLTVLSLGALDLEVNQP